MNTASILLVTLQIVHLGTAMNKKNENYQGVFDKIYTWLQQATKDEIKSIMNWVRKAEEVIKAAEHLSVNEYQLSVDDFKRDLVGLYRQSQQQTSEEFKQSLYVTALQEGMWQHLANMTDLAQIEWSELIDDFNHDGVYHAGDVIGFGTIVCQNCNKHFDILHASTVIPCPDCGATEFTRTSYEVSVTD